MGNDPAPPKAAPEPSELQRFQASVKEETGVSLSDEWARVLLFLVGRRRPRREPE